MASKSWSTDHRNAPAHGRTFIVLLLRRTRASRKDEDPARHHTSLCALPGFSACATPRSRSRCSAADPEPETVVGVWKSQASGERRHGYVTAQCAAAGAGIVALSQSPLRRSTIGLCSVVRKAALSSGKPRRDVCKPQVSIASVGKRQRTPEEVTRRQRLPLDLEVGHADDGRTHAWTASAVQTRFTRIIIVAR